MRIFVTGGSGFLGQRLIRRLTEEGHQVTALSRTTDSDTRLASLGATPVRGSLSDIPRWEKALDRQDILVHAAAPIDVWGRWRTFRHDILEASLQLYQFACDRRVKRFIYLSSESVLQDSRPLLDIDESTPYPLEPNSLYGKAKKLAEQSLLSHAGPTTLIILRPTFIWGAGESQLDTLLEKVRKGQFVWVDHGHAPMEHVHVDNVVEAIRLAMNRGLHKGIYFVTDDQPSTAREFLGALMEAHGLTPPEASLPAALVKPLAPLVESLWRLLALQSTPPLSRFQLDFIALPRRYRLDRIRRDLGYQPVRRLDEGLAEIRASRPLA
ncbi:hypothetical protein EV700_0408 [Fluviicoccus keumensis]|uniref:NAD-dependent epimerase/dehydratase domain-containing protein n=1 Tax=Fluviicoccus keumensis TaxID=1435465 RepID=A0A4V6MG10_9GAMM|nr:NAD(P)-dependent oxidoreductase [Fluviicoccus keumensis]RZU47446.1 hypothetical protein EV700_0408 [Fluviicoccus keumensis]